MAKKGVAKGKAKKAEKAEKTPKGEKGKAKKTEGEKVLFSKEKLRAFFAQLVAMKEYIEAIEGGAKGGAKEVPEGLKETILAKLADAKSKTQSFYNVSTGRTTTMTPAAKQKYDFYDLEEGVFIAGEKKSKALKSALKELGGSKAKPITSEPKTKKKAKEESESEESASGSEEESDEESAASETEKESESEKSEKESEKESEESEKESESDAEKTEEMEETAKVELHSDNRLYMWKDLVFDDEKKPNVVGRWDEDEKRVALLSDKEVKLLEKKKVRVKTGLTEETLLKTLKEMAKKNKKVKVPKTQEKPKAKEGEKPEKPEKAKEGEKPEKAKEGEKPEKAEEKPKKPKKEDDKPKPEEKTKKEEDKGKKSLSEGEGSKPKAKSGSEAEKPKEKPFSSQFKSEPLVLGGSSSEEEKADERISRLQKKVERSRSEDAKEAPAPEAEAEGPSDGETESPPSEKEHDGPGDEVEDAESEVKSIQNPPVEVSEADFEKFLDAQARGADMKNLAAVSKATGLNERKVEQIRMEFARLKEKYAKVFKAKEKAAEGKMKVAPAPAPQKKAGRKLED